MTGEDPQPGGEQDPPRLVIQALQLFGLCGFALAQPLFGILGSGPSFFIAHDAYRSDILAFTAVVLVLPPLVLLLVVRAAHRASPGAGRRAMAAAFGGLVALTLIPAIDRASPLPVGLFVALLVVVGAGGALAYERFHPIRMFSTFLSPAPVLFAVFFLLLSPLSGLVRSNQALAAPVRGAESTDVFILVLDELPLGALLGLDGAIDAARYPGFARLAGSSTWYRNATTVSPGTVYAVPALLTGRNPGDPYARGWPPQESDVPPLASTYPRSLFALLADSHIMDVREWVTRLCPPDLCVPSGEEGPSFAEDVWVVSQHLLLPTRFAEERLPSLDGRWAGFEGADGGADTGAGGEEDVTDELEQFDGITISSGDHLEAALPSVEPADSPRLWFVHDRRPHRPPNHLPDGTRYRRRAPFLWHANQDPSSATSVRQQYTLQLQYVDRLIGDLLDRLERQGLAEEALLVVTSDHGFTFEAPGHHRGQDSMDPDALSDVLPIPLFVRYPGQTDGEVDDRAAQLTDVLPTVTDVLDVALPEDWSFDGSSLRGPPPDRRALYWQPAGRLDLDETRLDRRRMPRQAADLFGTRPGPHDLYAMGPYGDLVGEEAAPLVEERAHAGRVDPLAPEDYEEVDLSSSVLPVLYEAEVDRVRDGDWLAVAVEGVVAGVAPVSPDPYGDQRVEVMLDPKLLVDGENEVEVFFVQDGSTLRPLRSS